MKIYHFPAEVVLVAVAFNEPELSITYTISGPQTQVQTFETLMQYVMQLGQTSKAKGISLYVDGLQGSALNIVRQDGNPLMKPPFFANPKGVTITYANLLPNSYAHLSQFGQMDAYLGNQVSF